MNVHRPYTEAVPDLHSDETAFCCKHCGRQLSTEHGTSWGIQLCERCEPDAAACTATLRQLMGAQC